MLAATACLSGTAAADTMSEQALRGKRIFVDGESESGAPLTAIVSQGATPIPASILPCAGCHGQDGQGRPEGGVVPPAVTWSYLTAANGHEHGYGRSHGPFETESLAAAIRRGVDPAGNALDTTMPRYQINDADMADLTAYLRHVELDFDAGLTDDSIRIGTLLPLQGPEGAVGRAMRQMLEAVFADINQRGGVHGRRIDLVVGEQPEDRLQIVWHARDLLQRESVFALVGNYSVGVEAELAGIVEELEVPTIGAFTPLPRSGSNGERHSFYLGGGLVEQAAVLARHITGSTGSANAKVAVIHPGAPIHRQALAAVQTQLETRGLPKATDIAYTASDFDAAAIADSIAEAGSDIVLFLSAADELNLLGNALLAHGMTPNLLMPGVFAGSNMFTLDDDYRGQLLVAYSSIPADHSPDAVREFEAMHSKYDFGYEHSAAQISSFVAAKVLVEGLKRAGRSLSREKLLSALEGLSEFHSGLMPPLSYNRKHRIGAYGGYVLEFDARERKFVAVGDWVSLRH